MAAVVARTRTHVVTWHEPAGGRSRRRSRPFSTAEEAAAFLPFAEALEEIARCQARLARARAALEVATTTLHEETHRP